MFGLDLSAGAIGGAVAVLLIYVFKRVHRPKVVHRDGWFYLTPGPVWWVLLCSCLGMCVAALVLLPVIAMSPSDPSYRSGLISAFLLIVMFGALSWMTYRLAFASEVRWNAMGVYKRTRNGSEQWIEWKEVQDVGLYYFTGRYWIRSQAGTEITFTEYMTGVKDLLIAAAGEDVGTRLYDMS